MKTTRFFQFATPVFRFLFIAALLGSGCASQVVGQTIGTWRRLEGPQFVVSTDGNLGAASTVLAQLENTRAALLAAAFPGRKEQETGTIEVVMLDSTQEWEALFPNFDGIFSRNLWQPFVFLPTGDGPERGTSSQIKHELFHALADFYLPVDSRWFQEGLAQYFETIDFDVERKEVSFGEPSENIMTLLANLRPASVQAFADGSFMTGADRHALTSYYTGSWLLVHFLANQMPKALVAYPALVQMRGEKGAWKAIFGGPDKYKQLDDTLETYRHAGGYVTITNSFEPPQVKGRVVPIAAADVYARYALLTNVSRLMRGPGDATPASADSNGAKDPLDRALSLDPAHPLALGLTEFSYKRPIDVSRATQATVAHPDDWMSWALLSNAQRRSGAMNEAGASHARALDLARKNPAVSYGQIRKSIH